MIRPLRCTTALAACLLAPALAVAQTAPAAVEPPPGAAPGTPVTAPVAPPPLTPAPTAPPPATVVAEPPPPASVGLAGAMGFGVGVIPNAALVGTAGAVSLKYWASDRLALAPLLSVAYDKPSDVDAAWHVRPEVVVLFVPGQGRSTRLEVGAGLGFHVGRAATAVVAPGSSLPTPPNTTFTLALPVQAGVEHFFARWFSMGIAARTDLFAYTKDGGSHEVSLSIDSTSLLGQLFFYTD